MNKQETIKAITDNVNKKHPWKISQDKYIEAFGDLPNAYLEERIYLDNLMERTKHFKLLFLPNLNQLKVEIKLTLDQLISWEIARWEEAKMHNILPSDIKKLLKEQA